MITRTDAIPSGRRSRRGLSRATRWNHETEIGTLRSLWERQCAVANPERPGASMAYVAQHFATDLILRRRLRVLDRITPWLQGRILEWGCQCAIDSCVYRMRLGDRVELHGADLYEPGAYSIFHEYAGLIYRRMTDHVLMDYDHASFDVVTSNGVLEHVLDDVGSVCEISRIIRPGGLFIVECLPNAWSYTEAIQRTLGHNAHDRLYTINSAVALISGGGFELLEAGYAFPLPTMLLGLPEWSKQSFAKTGRTYWALSEALQRCWPINRLSSNLWLVLRKSGASD
jgi:SAM-dependent methyltransferase